VSVLPRGGPFTTEKRKRFLELYSAGGSVKAAAEAAGTSHVSVFNLVRTDENFAKQYRLAQETNLDGVEDLLLRHATESRVPGNVSAIFGILNGRRPATWRQNLKLEHAGQISHQVAPEMLGAARERFAKMGDALPPEEKTH
jgi:hypothetical protein